MECINKVYRHVSVHITIIIPPHPPPKSALFPFFLRHRSLFLIFLCVLITPLFLITPLLFSSFSVVVDVQSFLQSLPSRPRLSFPIFSCVFCQSHPDYPQSRVTSVMTVRLHFLKLPVLCTPTLKNDSDSVST